jgi:hypothetical protein
MFAVVTVIFGVCNSMRLLQLLVVMIRKWSINPITNQHPVESHSYTILTEKFSLLFCMDVTVTEG